MILDTKVRFMLRHEISFRAKHGRGQGLKLSDNGDELDVLSVLQTAIDEDKAKITLRNSDEVRLTKVEQFPKSDMVALLFRRSDPDATPQMYEHRPTRKLRKADKTEDDAVTVSAHLFIKLTPIDGLRYEAVLEEVPGIGRTYVQSILLDVLRERTYESTDGRGDALETQTLVEVTGHKSDRLGDEAGQGRIEFVELVRPADTEGLDTEGVTKPQERMILRIDADAADPVGMVRRIKEWAFGRDWTNVKVKLKLPHDKSRLVSISREADAADVLFVKALRVELAKPLDACTEDVSEELLGKASGILNGG